MCALIRKKKPKLKQRQRLSERGDSSFSINNTSNFNRNQSLTKQYLSPRQPKKEEPPIDQSIRMKTHSLTDLRRRVFVVFLLVAFLIVALWVVLFNFTAEPVVSLADDQSTIKSIDAARYQDAIQDYLDSKPAYRVALLMNQSSLTSYIANKLPEVGKVTENGSAGIGKTNFAITLRKPVAGWKIDSQQYYVDSDGVQFELNYFNEPGVQIVDESGISITTSGTTTIASHRFLSFVGKVVSLASQYGYTVTKATLPADTTRQLQINIKEKSYSFKLSVDRPAGEQMEDMSNAIKYFDEHGLTPGYVDLRVSGEAFYK